MFKTLLKTALLAAALASPMAAQAFPFDESDSIDAYSAIIHAGRTANQVRSLHNVPSVGVVSISAPFVSPLSRLGDDLSNLRITADNYAGQISQLRRALAANPVTRHALQGAGVSVGRIVGVNVGSSGSLRVFIR